MSALPAEPWPEEDLGKPLPGEVCTPEELLGRLKRTMFPLPEAGFYTVEDWLKIPETGERIELIDGSYIVSPMAGTGHAVSAGRLRTILSDAAPGDLEVIETPNLQVGEDGLIPDIVVGSAEVILSDVSILSAADVVAVAEIVSPGKGNRVRDYEVKPLKYAQAGIPVYILVDPHVEGGPLVQVSTLCGGKYDQVAEAKAGETLTISEPFPVSFDPAELVGPRRR